jgi:hypothetical protein
MIFKERVCDTCYVARTSLILILGRRGYTFSKLSTLLKSVYGKARSVIPRSMPFTPLAIAQAARTKFATSPDGRPYPMKTIRLPVNNAFNRIMIGWVSDPEVVRCGCRGNGCGDERCGDEKQFISRITENCCQVWNLRGRTSPTISGVPVIGICIGIFRPV